MVILRRHNCTDATCIREHLLRINEKKWGFFIYRTCYYDDPGRWNRFMEQLKGFARIGLLNYDPEGDGAAIIDDLEWNVQDDPAMEGSGPAPGTWRAINYRNPTAYVIAMNMRWWDRQEEEARRGPQPDDDDDDDEEGEECYPLINGCQRYNVGWTKVSVSELYPRLYSLLVGSDLWRVVYKRPPKISTGGP
ncbi:uncharacterized protein ASPGLDRAFT_82485 [Aspergillus glaucus CBS 516.65]|uniref:Uncharacterized protein n=1 Tax=Aspergillus glaucus CBS 516.65 TaxID=1160497 RepID=A0A1L9VIR3_ASPGL|nr:hypothetical protein ASPGLDRAFT_82485 [Aspergillus glaucus CBS 516.65]OJJ83780.1 hypothetical protein ASPGLDRAFT_82485 [Aspergillus glaucus CBS 516.65]